MLQVPQLVTQKPSAAKEARLAKGSAALSLSSRQEESFMNKTGFTMSMLVVLSGVMLMSGGLLLQAVLPKLGRMAFLIGGGTYSPDDYHLGILFYLQQIIAITCIVIGGVLSRRFCTADSDHRHRE